MSMQSTGNIFQSHREVVIRDADTAAAEGAERAGPCEVLGSIEQDRPVHSTGVWGLLNRAETRTMQNGTLLVHSNARVEQRDWLRLSHDPLDKRGSWRSPETRAGGLMVFDYKGRLVMADASAELMMAALGVEWNRGSRLRIDALDMSDARSPGDWELPDWLDPEWIEPVTEGSERLGTVVQIRGPRRSASPTQGGLPAYKLRKAVEFIQAHIDQQISLRQLAALVSLSPFHFHREFKRSTGLTPGKYISEARIERAKTLLGESDLPLVEVAAQVGYADQSHFTVAFRRATSMTPGTYRNAMATLDDHKESLRSRSRLLEQGVFHKAPPRL